MVKESKWIGLISLLILAKIGYGQRYTIIYKDAKDSTQNFYVVRPPKDSIRGLLVLNDHALSDSAKSLAYQQGIMTLTVVPTNDPLRNLTDKTIVMRIHSMVLEVITKYQISPSKIIVGGMSAAGTGAIRYVQYCYQQSSLSVRPVGVFGVDAPLDYERLYRESIHAIERKFSPDAVEEGHLVSRYLKTQLKATPQSNQKVYQQISPFCYSAPKGGNAHWLNHTAVRLYIEPDINWWITQRRKDFYDLNAIDNAALANWLQINGNSRAELVVTANQGVRETGEKHPHSWSIVDQKKLLSWCTQLFKNQN
ncbi:hypothetical protein [Spirosoma pollinicola]|uniref:Alpha/beta hydrolase n=1 Tax=Spirosoma pollinicola TaxID=2057025 RepID=A0A2K8Z2J3_9BACT|nr:hypothetical protein [Spirosoma pollinicola]AUD04106.1 hypothetical protein CWM47_21095 [Spirosoma pollinicola]